MSEDVQEVVKGNPHLRVILVDDELETIPAVLGISSEREKELDELVKKIHNESQTITDTFVEISKRMKHANELAYCLFHVGAHIGRAYSLKEELMGHFRDASGKKNKEKED
jgi:hypothetical protein